MQKIIIGLAPNVTVEVEGDDVKQLIEKASFWNSLPHECPLCQASLVFFHRLTQSDDAYWGQVCTGSPTHEANFGVYKKESRGFYYKGEWREAYGAYQNGGGQGDDFSGQPSAPPANQVPAHNMPPAQSPPRDPVARNLGDMITSKQLNMIRAIARDANMDAEAICKEMFACGIDELSKRAASDLIDRLQALQQSNRANPAQAPNPATVAAPTPAPSTPAPTKHPIGCTCSACDDNIPF
jgi:hypothetical protein